MGCVLQQNEDVGWGEAIGNNLGSERLFRTDRSLSQPRLRRRIIMAARDRDKAIQSHRSSPEPVLNFGLLAPSSSEQDRSSAQLPANYSMLKA